MVKLKILKEILVRIYELYWNVKIINVDILQKILRLISYKFDYLCNICKSKTKI
jgi:hypothetical protein